MITPLLWFRNPPWVGILSFQIILKKQSKISKLLTLGQKRLNWDSIPTHDVLLAKSYKPMNNNTPFSSIVLYVVVCSGCWHGSSTAIGSPQRRSPVLLLLFCRAYRLVGPNARIPPKIRFKNFRKTLTNFEYQVYTMTGNGNHLTLLNLAWENLWNDFR